MNYNSYIIKCFKFCSVYKCIPVLWLETQILKLRAIESQTKLRRNFPSAGKLCHNPNTAEYSELYKNHIIKIKLTVSQLAILYLAYF